jgi:hypothetical protein
MQHYLNVINSSQDPDYSEYNNFLGKIKSIEELIHITDIFDYEEDNDELGDDNDPLFNESLKPQEVVLQGGWHKIDVLSSIPTHGTETMKKRLRDLCNEYSDIFSRFFKTEAATVPSQTLDLQR